MRDTCGKLLISLVSVLLINGCTSFYNKYVQWEAVAPETFPIIHGVGYAPISLQKSTHETQRMLMAIKASKIAIYLGFILDGGSITALFELPAFIIVVGGTLGAVMLQSSSAQFFHALSLLKWVFTPPRYDVEKGIEQIVSWAVKSRESGFLSLENDALDEEDSYTQKGLNLLVDGVEIENLQVSLELDLEVCRENNLRSAHVFESMGGYSPTIGILGAVLGLIHAMNNLTEPALLGQGIATAFIATIYGVGFANLLYLPVANKIKETIHQQTMYREMIFEGLLAIARGENPHAIENKLSAFRLNK